MAKLNKKTVKIPIRVVAKADSDLAKIDEPIAEIEKARPKPNKPLKSIRRSNKPEEKKKMVIWVTVVSVLIFSGWLFYFKGVINKPLGSELPLGDAGQELTNVFSSFSQVFSNVQKINEIENSPEQKIEEFEQRVFPQFSEE
ncbi:hypothetical protein KKI23_00600 [Patescibacteria group bacterium]|nr:hypothetical protein [Patescibacteria group bacterium]